MDIEYFSVILALITVVAALGVVLIYLEHYKWAVEIWQLPKLIAAILVLKIIGKKRKR